MSLCLAVLSIGDRFRQRKYPAKKRGRKGLFVFVWYSLGD